MKFDKWQERQRRRWENSEEKREARRIANRIKEDERIKAEEWVNEHVTTSTTASDAIWIEWGYDEGTATPTFHSRVRF